MISNEVNIMYKNFKLIAILMLTTLIILTGCELPIKKKSDYPTTAKRFISQLAVNNQDVPSSYKEVIAIDKKHQKDLEKYYKEYKNNIDKNDLKNKDYKKLDHILTEIYEVNHDFMKNINQIGNVKNIDESTYTKHLEQYLYLGEMLTSNVAIELDEFNLEYDEILGEKHASMLEDLLTNEEMPTTQLRFFAYKQDHGYVVPKNQRSNISKIDLNKYQDYTTKRHNKKLSKQNINEVIDSINNKLDDDIQFKHVDDTMPACIVSTLSEELKALNKYA